MSNFKKILDSFLLKDSLNPKIWENPEDPKKATLKTNVRKSLEKIAEEFIEYLGDDVFVQDIILTGSLSNFNWSEFSDFDLHVIIDYKEYGKNKDLYKELFDLKKFVFNTNHDIKIYGYDVELYAQDEEEAHFASGVYSIMEDKWIKIPKKEKFDLDQKVLSNKIKCWVEKIENAIKTSTDKDDKEIIEKVKDKLKEYRKSGLEKDGELSYENLVFKFLRRSGHIEKLFNMKNKVMDKELSLERRINEDTLDGLSPTEIVSNSPFLKSIDELHNNSFSVEYTPGQKIPYQPEVEKIQTGLQMLGFSLPEWGVDGKFGPETEKATIDFQNEVNLTPTGIFGPKDAIYLIAKLIVKGFKEADLSSIKRERQISSNSFTYLDLNKPTDYEAYKLIAQTFINKRNPNAYVTGEMLAQCAKRYFSRGYIPPELALAQLTLEGGISKNTDAKPIRTKNPFNVGNTDSGEENVRPSFEDGVCIYYDLMVRRYLTTDRNPEELLQNFVNVNGQRYASGTDYEEDLGKLVNSINPISREVLVDLGLSTTDLRNI